MKNRIIIAVFALMLCIFAVILICPADEKSAEEENRTLASMPELTKETVFSGEFEQDFESFIDDNLGFRSFFTSLNERITSSKGISTPAGRLVYTDTDIGTGTTQKASLLIVNKTIFEIFVKNTAHEEEYIEAVNNYAEKLDDDIKLYAALIPTQLEFQEPIYANMQDSQKETIDYIYNQLDERVTTVDMYSQLQQHSGEYVYFRSDHHWTPLGAYYGYTAFSQTAGMTPVNKDNFEKNNIPNFLGYLYKQAGAPEIAEDPDTIEWYDTDKDNEIELSMQGFENGEKIYYNGTLFDKTKANYNFFLSGDHPLAAITNKKNPTGKTIVIVRDSFANAFAPWIIQNYKTVVLVDPRNYEADFQDVLDEYHPDEVLIMNYIFTTTFEDYCTMLKDLYRAP
ncbi:MAG: hypothetical protein LIO59_07030 [Oscillospiraceae bacterium]|nr:hypothetical protein [Oscillospiraceae bacterium]